MPTCAVEMSTVPQLVDVRKVKTRIGVRFARSAPKAALLCCGMLMNETIEGLAHAETSSLVGQVPLG